MLQPSVSGSLKVMKQEYVPPLLTQRNESSNCQQTESMHVDARRVEKFKYLVHCVYCPSVVSVILEPSDSTLSRKGHWNLSAPLGYGERRDGPKRRQSVGLRPQLEVQSKYPAGPVCNLWCWKVAEKVGRLVIATHVAELSAARQARGARPQSLQLDTLCVREHQSKDR
jgi:hypothetical protein